MSGRILAVFALFLFLLLQLLNGCGNRQLLEHVESNLSSGTDDRAAGQGSIPEHEIAGLTPYQQSLLADAGWNLPLSPTDSDQSTGLPDPDLSLLQDVIRQQIGNAALPQGNAARTVSDHTGIMQGQYPLGAVDENGNPAFGCNADPTLVDGLQIEDVIAAYPLGDDPGDYYAIANMDQYSPSGNYFSNHPGSQSRRLVSQLFNADGDAEHGVDPAEHILELAYPADEDYAVRPGEGPGPGGPLDCAKQAISLRDAYWLSFHEQHFGLPDGATGNMHDILFCPAAEVTPELVNPATGSQAGMQPFLFGTLLGKYEDAYIIGIEAADSGCEVFDSVANADWSERTSLGSPFPNILHNPLFGVTATRWQQSAIPGTDAWQSLIGWPVTRPFAYRNGALQLSISGEYHVFGQFFERGFIWWLDYDQQQYPEARDRAILYTFDGSNAFCEGEYQRLQPDLQYNNETAPLAAELLVDMYRSGNGDWFSVELLADGPQLVIPWTDEGAGQRSATLRALVNPSGGSTVDGADIGQPDWGPGLYRSCTWLWHDGSITPAGTDYDPAQFEAVHTYSAAGDDIAAVYTVRAQIVDADGNIFYVDSLPVVIGDGSAGREPVLSLLRADNGRFPAGHQALLEDLGKIGLPFVSRIWEPGIEHELESGGTRLVIWYDGGPGAADEIGSQAPRWTVAETESLLGLLELDIPVLLVSQQLGLAPEEEAGNAWTDYFGMNLLDGSLATDMLPMAWGQLPGEQLGFFGGSDWLPSSPQNLAAGSPAELQLIAGTTERGAAGGSAADLPLLISLSPYYPLSGVGHAAGWPGVSRSFVTGSHFLTTETSPAQALVSWGSTAAPHTISGGAPEPLTENGNARFWIYGASWSATQVFGFDGSSQQAVPRSSMLRNILSWLDQDSGFFSPLRPAPYAGEPEIISVTPMLIAADGSITPGAVSRTGVDYPDPSGSDVLRSSSGGAGDNRLQTDTGIRPENEDGLNGNDIDLQFPFYAYITWDDSLGLAAGEIEPGEVLGVQYAGLLLEEDSDWQRADPFLAGYVQPSQLLDRPVAGYYLSLTGDSGDEQRATYGLAAPQLMVSEIEPVLLVEAIAHWPAHARYGGQIPQLRWSMFPGHKVPMHDVAVAGQFISGYTGEAPLAWKHYVEGHDIDPGLDSDLLGRNAGGFLQSDFSWVNVSGQRNMQFGYGSVFGFGGDLNDNHLLEAADKFPVRVRLITDYERYGTYVDAGLDWPNTFPPQDSYIEAGCYVALSHGNMSCIQVLDNPDEPDPHETAVLDEAPYTYDVQLDFLVECASSPIDVELDWNYDGITWGNSGLTQFVGTFASGPEISQTVSIDFSPGGSGTYYLAIRINDGSVPGQTADFVWPIPFIIE